MEDKLKKKFETLMYFLIKDACNYSFEEFLEDLDISIDEYKRIKKHLEEVYSIKMYV